ncbi:unnamed protein product [Fraxinus pennsylvanica]|uniref:Uncharacterized protein n=1 Tax=Fraxinus pennsylvanica TaxID=56036 RepID=A0AAD1ZVB5_9LAMI|nr:unnamed protein product [Fraxinus pennsylvanica]
MLDENLSSQDEEISIYDVDLDKEITSSSEDLCSASSHLSGIDENESRSREEKKVTEQNPICPHSFSPRKTDYSNSRQSSTKNFGELQSCLVSAQEPSDTCEKLKSELNPICDVNGSEMLQDIRGNQIEQSLKIDSESTEHNGSNSEKQDKTHHMLELKGSEYDNRIYSKDSDSRLKKESDDPQASVSPTNVAVEQIPAAPTVENNILDELRTGVSSEIFSQSSLPLKDSTTHPHNGAYIEQESSHYLEKSTEEVDTHSDVDEPTIYEDQMENLALFEDTEHEGQLNYPVDHEECTTSERFGDKGEL